MCWSCGPCPDPFDKNNINYTQVMCNGTCMKTISDFHDLGLCKFQLVLLDTLKKSYKRPPHIFSSSSESKIRSIKIHDHMNKPMSNSGSVGFCIPKCVILLTQTKHV